MNRTIVRPGETIHEAFKRIPYGGIVILPQGIYRGNDLKFLLPKGNNE